MNKIIAPLLLVAALALTGCSGAGATPAPDSDSKSAEEAPAGAAPQIPDLAGAWKQSNPASEDSYQQATITDDTITVEWVADGGATTSIYWAGTFTAPTDGTAPYTWTSERDVAATESAMLASSDPTKDFTFEGDTISYKVSALGTTTTVELKKN